MKKQVVYILVLLFVVAGIILVSSGGLDINNDGVVNITDLQLLAAHFQGKGSYNASYDLNNNSKVDLFDLVAVARNVNLSSNSSGGNESNKTILFHSDWSTATGNSTTAITDGGKWPHITNSFNHLNVVSASSYFPNASFSNALQAQLQDTRTASLAVNIGDPAPAVGESRYWRVYLYIDYSDNTSSYGGGGNHPVSDYCGGCGDNEGNRLWVMHIYYTTGSNKFGMWFQQEGGQDAPYDVGNVLSLRTPYRIEIKVTRTSLSTYTENVRVYNASDVLLYTGADFLARYGSNSGNPLTSGVFNLTGSDLWSSFVVGTNGVSGWPASNETIYHIFGGAAICDNWCGPYSSGV